MVLEHYDLGSIRAEIRLEFGQEDTGLNNARVDNKINQAQAWVAGRRDWPWMRTEHIVDIGASVSGYGVFTKGSRVCSIYDQDGVALPSGIGVRDIISLSSSAGDQTTGYLIAAISGTTVTLSSQFRGNTNTLSSLVAVTATKGYFELPEDFLRGESLVRQDTLGDWRPIFRGTKECEFIRNNTIGISLRRQVYTVTTDPLATSKRYFLAVYPYVGEVCSFKLPYHRVVPKLINGSDEPIIPLNDRIVLIHAGSWFFGQSIGNERAPLYRDMALQKIQDMLKHVDLMDEEEIDSVFSSDPSGYIPGPNNFPMFEE